MSLRVKNILVVSLLMLAVNLAVCAALMRARDHQAEIQLGSRVLFPEK